jgi:hypothetical protein
MLLDDLRGILLSHRTAAGGWPYMPGKSPRIEPTCWGLLALAALDGRAAPDTAVLAAWPRRDGWLEDVAGAPPNYAFNALAGLTLMSAAAGAAAAAPLAARIVAGRSIEVPQTDLVRLDGSLRAWPWVDGTASWVEPTSWCLLLLKKRRAIDRRQETRDRIEVGERMLRDRVCRDGGWNYGNSQVYGQDLWPYVPTTAVALLALQDRRDDPEVRRSLVQLQKDVAAERSMLALALAVLCLRTYGLPVEPVRGELLGMAETSVRDGRAPDHLLAVSMTACALAQQGAPHAFAL